MVAIRACAPRRGRSPQHKDGRCGACVVFGIGAADHRWLHLSGKTSGRLSSKKNAANWRTNAEAVINSIDRIIEVRLTEVVAMASNPSVVNYLASGAADPLAVETVVGEYRSYLSMRTDIKALSLIYAANGNVALSTSANQGQFPGNRPFFKSAVAGA